MVPAAAAPRQPALLAAVAPARQTARCNRRSPWALPRPPAARPPPRRVSCAAATEEDSRRGGRQTDSSEPNGTAHGTSTRNGWADDGLSGGDADRAAGTPLQQRIAACSTASQLHQLLLRHSGELDGTEVATALETTAKRSLLQPHGAPSPTGRGASSGGNSEDASAAGTMHPSAAALAGLLVQLAAAHASSMDPPALSAAAWALGALRLAQARPLLQSMHALAQARLVQYSPSQLCSLLWSGAAADPAFRSPLFADLAGLLQRGMSLSLFTPHDLAMLAWLCGRERGSVARDVLTLVAAECRSRLEIHHMALERIEQQHTEAAAQAAPKMPGVNWVHDLPATDIEPAMGVRVRIAAWKRMMSVIKRELVAVAAGDVIAALQLGMCSRAELNPVVLCYSPDGQPLNESLDVAKTRHAHRTCCFRLLARMHGLQEAAAGGARQNSGGLGARADYPAAALSRAEAEAVLQECRTASMFWEAVTARARRIALAEGGPSFSAVVCMASGRRVRLTWSRQGGKLLPVELAELAPLVDRQWYQDVQEREQPSAASTAAPPPPPQQLPPPPFGPQQAAMLLTGLAQLQLRVGGVVEPLLQQNQTALQQADAEDVARILVALGELQMEPSAELTAPLVDRLAKQRGRLEPCQMTTVMWATSRVARWPRVVRIGVRHMAARLPDYRPVDIVGTLWACAQLNGTMPDGTLVAALQRLPQAELQACSTSALCNLLWALGRLVAMRAGSEMKASWVPGRKPVDTAWLSSPACLTVQAATHAAAAELAGRVPQLRPAELSSAAVAFAAHAAHLQLLPGRAVAIVRRACSAAAAADAFSGASLAHLTIAAARLRWSDAVLLDAVAAGLLRRRAMLSQPGEVVRALAGLAPGRYGALFATLGRRYAMWWLRQSRAPQCTFLVASDVEERSATLVAFAVVGQAQGLPQAVAQELMATVTDVDVKKLPPPGLIAVLELAVQAQADGTTPLLVAFRNAIAAALPSMNAELLRQARSALRRLGCYGGSLETALEAQLARQT